MSAPTQGASVDAPPANLRQNLGDEPENGASKDAPYPWSGLLL